MQRKCDDFAFHDELFTIGQSWIYSQIEHHNEIGVGAVIVWCADQELQAAPSEDKAAIYINTCVEGISNVNKT